MSLATIIIWFGLSRVQVSCFSGRRLDCNDTRFPPPVPSFRHEYVDNLCRLLLVALSTKQVARPLVAGWCLSFLLALEDLVNLLQRPPLCFDPIQRLRGQSRLSGGDLQSAQK
jgi:hypothetical protein